MSTMRKEERDAYARRNWIYYAFFFSAFLGYGLYMSNWVAMLGAVLGYAWLIRAQIRKPDEAEAQPAEDPAADPVAESVAEPQDQREPRA